MENNVSSTTTPDIRRSPRITAKYEELNSRQSPNQHANFQTTDNSQMINNQQTTNNLPYINLQESLEDRIAREHIYTALDATQKYETIKCIISNDARNQKLEIRILETKNCFLLIIFDGEDGRIVQYGSYENVIEGFEGLRSNYEKYFNIAFDECITNSNMKTNVNYNSKKCNFENSKLFYQTSKLPTENFKIISNNFCKVDNFIMYRPSRLKIACAPQQKTAVELKKKESLRNEDVIKLDEELRK